MSFEVKIPAVGESISSGILSEWKQNDGAVVQPGDVLFSLETDKIATEITADKGGTLRIKAAAGQEVRIGEVVALIEESESAVEQAARPPADISGNLTPATTSETVKTQGDATARHAATKAAELPTTKVQSPALFRAGVQPAAAPANTSRWGSLEADHTGTTQGVLQLSPGTAIQPAKSISTDRETRKPLTPLRKKIAQQLVFAQQNAAILTTFNECDMSAVFALRKKLQEEFTKTHGIKLGLMSFFVKAAVEALRSVPVINGRIEGDDFVQNHYYDIGVAVSTDRGLMVPVIRDADAKSFAQIERELADYAARAREGRIKIDDLQGGVFTITNGGIFGSLMSTPILNPPQIGILGMHTIKERAVVVDGQVVARPMMYLALSYDHRAVDGREAVTFLVRVKDCIEEPARLLVQA